MIIGYILLGFGAVLIVILALIYQKLNKKSENTDLKDDFNLERERKKDFEKRYNPNKVKSETNKLIRCLIS